MKFIDWKKLREMMPYSRTHIQRLENDGKWPKRIRLGNGPRSRVAWDADEIEAHLARLKAQR